MHIKTIYFFSTRTTLYIHIYTLSSTITITCTLTGPMAAMKRRELLMGRGRCHHTPCYSAGISVEPSQSLCNNGPPEWINASESVRSLLHITLRAFLFPPKASQACLNFNQDFVLLRLDETRKWAVLHQAINFALCGNKARWSRLLEVLTDGFSRLKIQIYLPACTETVIHEITV